MELEKNIILTISRDGMAYAKRSGSRPIEKTVHPDDHVRVDLDERGYMVGVEYDTRDIRMAIILHRDLPL